MRKYIIVLLLSIGLLNNAFSSSMKKIIYTPNAPMPIGTYSQAVMFGNTIYMSGQIAIDPATGELVSGDFSEQARQVFKNIIEIAKASGGSTDDILKLTIYLPDLNNFSKVNAIMQEFFHEPYPARSTVEIKALPKNAVLEIEAIMAAPAE